MHTNMYLHVWVINYLQYMEYFPNWLTNKNSISRVRVIRLKSSYCTAHLFQHTLKCFKVPPKCANISIFVYITIMHLHLGKTCITTGHRQVLIIGELMKNKSNFKLEKVILIFQCVFFMWYIVMFGIIFMLPICTQTYHWPISKCHSTLPTDHFRSICH